jgi:molybdate transport system substrate-binding protein
MSKIAKASNLHHDPSTMRTRSASVPACGVSVVLRAAVRLSLLQVAALAFLLGPLDLRARAQFHDVLVFGDASLKNALEEANNLFRFENGSGVVVSYGASPELAKQIESGKPADVFISADLDSMDYVAERKLIKPDTREKFLGNKLVLIARADSTTALTIGANFPLAQALGDGRLAIADPASVATGKYGKAALEKLGVWASVADKVASAQDTRAALLLVSRGEAPLGIVFQSDATADKSVRIVATFPEGSHPPIIYPIAIMASSTNEVASIYVQYLLSPKAEPFFEKQGFTVY